MFYLIPLIASALMFFFAFCAMRAIRDYSGSWVIFSVLAGLMFGTDVILTIMIIGESVAR